MIQNLYVFAFQVLAPVFMVGAALAGGMIRRGDDDDDEG
jgi:hypothetical protein